MKVLIIPDIHGRTAWKDIDNPKEYDRIVFLGDYLDCYPGEKNIIGNEEIAITPDFCVTNFKEILDFAKNNNNVVLLLGNHDLPYFSKEYTDELGNYWCRHDYINHNEIEKLFLDNIDLFQFAYDIDIEDKTYLFTHAGLNYDFKQRLGLISNTAKEINEYFSIPERYADLAVVSRERGGDYFYGSIVWADIREYYDLVKEVFQIFGHTRAYLPIIKDNFAMLDRPQHLYLLTEKGIKDFKE